ncbi:MAG: hypothetical protein U0P81_05250 [Holophagaceae bacterium]
MPRPCPKCHRPVPDARKACMYCGTPAPEGGPSADPPASGLPAAGSPLPGDLQEPEKLSSVAAVSSLVSLAAAAYQRQDLPATERLMSRPFLEVHPDDLRAFLGIMTEAWLRAVMPVVGPLKVMPASAACARGIEAAVHQRYGEASQAFADARFAFGDVAKLNPVAELLALGALAAGKAWAAREAREPELKQITEAASRLVVTPDRKAEAVPLLKQALALMDPKRFPEDRARAAKFEALIRELEAEPAPLDPGDAAAALPPDGSLTGAGWDELGLRVMPHRVDSARLCFQRAVKAEPANGEFRLHLAMAVLASEAPDDEVIAAFREAVRLAPKDGRALTGLAASLQEAGRYGEACATWDRVLAQWPGEEKALRNRAFCGEAEALFKHGADLKAGDWVQIGMQLFDEGRWQLADLSFSRALAMSPGLHGGLCGKGIANFRWGEALKAEGNAAATLRFRMAKEAVEAALKVNPGTPGLADVLDLCRKALGEG